MLTLNDGRSELWQWDTGRKLTVDADCSQVHFSNKVFGRSIDVDVVDGVAEIPDFLLQTDKDLTAWAFVGTPESGYTKISKVFKVNRRNKPAGYVFTPSDQTTLDDILNRIEDLEKRPSGDVSKEDIQDAVNEYLDNNPVSVDEKDPTVPDWAKQPEPPKTEIPGTLPNPHKLTFTGAVQAEYDGNKEVTVEIPEGGPGGIPIPETAEVGQTIVVKAVDENGKPTEWEAVDMASGGGEKEWAYYREQEVGTDDGISVIEFDNLLQYDEALLFIFTPYGKTCTAAVYINGVQVEKDWYNFQHASSNRQNTLHISRIKENYYWVSGYGGNYCSTKVTHRASSELKLRGICDATSSGGINKIGFTVSPILSSASNGSKCIIRYFAR